MQFRRPCSAPWIAALLAAAACLGGVADPLAAQQPAAVTPLRPLAPGVLTVIPPDPKSEETFTGPLPIVELLAHTDTPTWDPNFRPKSETLREMAKQVTLRRAVWNLEFAFKPLRMIEVDVPQETLKMQRKLVWYMVFRVRYRGRELHGKPETDQWNHVTYPGTEKFDLEGRRFFPSMVLRSHEFNKSYLDRIIPAAKRPIELKEMKGGKLFDTVEITRINIPINGEVWGVATWEDVDPRVDYCSLFIQGLTNAYRFQDEPGVYKAGDPPGTGRTYAYKTLQLNFWRPGDTEMEHEREIRFGVPIDFDPEVQRDILQTFGLTERLDYRWIYR